MPLLVRPVMTRHDTVHSLLSNLHNRPSRHTVTAAFRMSDKESTVWTVCHGSRPDNAWKVLDMAIVCAATILAERRLRLVEDKVVLEAGSQ